MCGKVAIMKQRRKATGPTKWVDTARGRIGVAEYPSGEIRLYIEYDAYLAIAEAHLGPAGGVQIGGQQNLLLRPYKDQEVPTGQ
jgi:hypothetical protein